MSTAPPRSLAEQLRSWPDDRLAVLLRQRPDLGVPAPQDSTQLASRAAARPSVLRMLDQLDRLHLTVLEAVVVLGAGCTGAQVREVVHAAPTAVDDAVRHLLAVALLWGDEDHLRPISILGDLLGPLAAGAAHAPRRTPDRVRELLAEISPQARAMLEHVEASGLVGAVEQADRRVTPERARTPVEELLARALLTPRDHRHVTVPPDVAIVLRGGRTTRDEVTGPPPLATSERDRALVDRAAAGAAGEFTQRVELLLETWGATPPAALRSGGLGVRDLRAATALLGAPEEVTVLAIEVAAAADLLAIGATDDLDEAWLPTDAFDAWRAQDTAQRWSRLAHAWLESPRLAAAVGTKDGRGRTLNPLAEGAERSWAVDTRREVLTALAALPDGRVLAATTGAASLVTHLEWRRPRRPTGREELVAATLAEAAALGVVALGGAAVHGAALLEGADAAAAALAPLLPPPVDHVLIQADLTAVAPGPLEHELATKLATLADVESRGGATVYRFDAGSIRRAFDAGWSAEEVHTFIAEASRTPVPQPLVYLVDDVSRRFGTVRVGAATAFVRSDDEHALAELVHDPRTAALRLRRIAPTVVITDAPTDVLLATLRDVGVAPVLEASDGTVRLARRDTQRARTPRRRTSPGVAQARDAARVSAVVTAVRAGDRAVAARPTTATTSSPAAVLSQLRDAVESGRSVWIGYTDNEGGVSERVVEPRRVDGGWLTAHDARSDDTRAFALHRITAVRPL